MEEQDLISKSRSGDLEAFNQLVEKYQRLVYNLAYRMLGQAAAAEDATQDTFLAAFRGIRSFKGGNFKSWLLQIAANCCRDQFRSAKRAHLTSLDAILDDPLGKPMPDDTRESPEDYALRKELGKLINDGLAHIPEEQRMVVILYDIHGLSYEEIAQVTNSSLGTVKSRLNRGRGHLKDFLTKHKELLPAKFHLNN